VVEPASPEHDWYLHHDDGRSVELGTGVFLMSGSGGGALAGPLLFAEIEAGHGVFLRPSAAFGQTLSSIPPSNVRSATWGAGRFDACLRLPGLYTQHHGMQLDLCLGTDVGMTHIDSTIGTDLPYWAVGPSVQLRGELGGRLSAMLRTAVGIDILQGSYLDDNGASQQQPLANARLELAFSWDVTPSPEPKTPSGSEAPTTSASSWLGDDGQGGPRPSGARDQFEPERVSRQAWRPADRSAQ
jgi:hypothetical protein